MSTNDVWPKLDLAVWGPTKRSLHAYAQMLGKLRLALAPHQPNFLFTSLALGPRGFTTGAMPVGPRSLEASLDVFDATIVLETSDGARETIALAEPTTVADVFAAFRAALTALHVDVTLSPVPQEVPDVTPFDGDRRPAAYDADHARAWLRVMTTAHGIFDRWRAHFFGRTGLQLWWGAFDLALLLFNGKHANAPAARGYLLKYDLDAEMMNAGFYPGDDANPAFFYAYVYPQPAGCASLSIRPASATWSQSLGEWVLPYETLRASADPDGDLVAFLDAVYDACGNASGWDRADLSYVAPPLRRAR